ncbi:MAG: hypothetical protein Q7T13_13725 [Polaromonas sp.]|nr:hypothetical protein [Polaromonas sp.]MDO9258528.1 hypothetical protein [Polaromonas sp.]
MEDEAWEERAEWIRERLDDPEADEDTERWDELSEEFDREHQFHDDDQYEDDWVVEGKSRLEIFDENIEATLEILNQSVKLQYEKNLVVMLFGHVVATVEAYLSSTFIHYALSSENHMRRLVESDPEFAKRKFTVQEIFTKKEELKSDLSEYLKGLIFHDIAKVKPLYHSVLDVDFGEVKWLFQAVLVRHHCVHRAGYDKNGDEVGLKKEDVRTLTSQSTELIHEIESILIGMPIDGDFFWKT